LNLQSVTLKVASGELAQVARTLALEPGAELAARVVATGPQAGRGTIALAGMTLPARVPAGVEAGQTLRLQVVRIEPGQLTVKVVPAHAAAAQDGATLAQAAGRLAVSGDGDLTAAGLALANGRPLWLPDGGAAEVAVEPDGESAGRAGGPSGVAAFCLHSPSLGTIEVRMTMAGGSVRAGVVTSPGAATELADAALPQLIEGLARATGRPASAMVSERPATAPVPRPPAGRVDVQA
jgi:hypothetical protein